MIKMKFDLARWQNQIKAQQNVVLKAAEKIFIEAVEQFKVKVEARTPVGDPSLWKSPAPSNYTPGQLKAGWQIEYNSKKTVAYVFNDVVYGPVIEYGSWSTQAPQGMMRITAKEWPQIIEAVAKKHKV